MEKKSGAVPFLTQLLTGNVINRLGLEFRPVANLDELRQAARLVYNKYMNLGYIQPSQTEIRMTIFQALPTTKTFVAVTAAGNVIATLTIIQDSALGLPMDKLYPEQLEGLRRQGKRLFE